MTGALRLSKRFFRRGGIISVVQSLDAGSPIPWVTNISTWCHRSRRRLFSPELRLFDFIFVIALICLLASSPAIAENECGSPPSNGIINCSGSHNGTIQYTLEGDLDWVINLQAGIDVDTTVIYDHALHVIYGGTGSLTINMLGGSLTTGGNYANGINVISSESDTGPVKVKMSGGEIETSGSNAVGIRVIAENDEDIEIEVVANDDSETSITTGGNNSYGIYADHIGSGDIVLKLLNGAKIESNNANTVHSWHDGSGNVDIRVGGHLISDANALYISSKSTSLVTIILESATIEAGSKAIRTDSANDNLKVTGGTTEITGNIDFGTGMDTMTFQTDSTNDVHFTLMSMITGLESIRKIGTGAAHLSDISSSGSVVGLEEGDLYLSGHFNIGSSGFTVKDASRLIFATGDGDYGRITASQVKFSDSDWQRAYIGDGSLTALDGKDVLVNANCRFKDDDGEIVEPSLYNVDGSDTGMIINGKGIVNGEPIGNGDDPPGDGDDPPGDGDDPPGDGDGSTGDGDDIPGDGDDSAGSNSRHIIRYITGDDIPGNGGDPPGNGGDPTSDGGGSGGCSIGGGDTGNGSIATAGLLLFLFGLIMLLETGRKTRKKLKGATVS